MATSWMKLQDVAYLHFYMGMMPHSQGGGGLADAERIGACVLEVLCEIGQDVPDLSIAAATFGAVTLIADGTCTYPELPFAALRGLFVSIDVLPNVLSSSFLQAGMNMQGAHANNKGFRCSILHQMTHGMNSSHVALLKWGPHRNRAQSKRWQVWHCAHAQAACVHVGCLTAADKVWNILPHSEARICFLDLLVSWSGVERKAPIDCRAAVLQGEPA
jgi:hypothetical protein